MGGIEGIEYSPLYKEYILSTEERVKIEFVG